MNKYKNYAFSVVCYMLENMPEKMSARITDVILFGSVAQGTANEESDIDLFFNTDLSETQAKNIKKMLNKNAEAFYLSSKALSYKLQGVNNRISIIVGKLDDWKDLKHAIISTGIVLFGRYKSGVEKNRLKQHFIISWDTPRKNRGAFLNKLYGYTVKKKHYPGMTARYGCIRIGKSAIIVPSEHRLRFVGHMEKCDVGYRIIEVFL